MKSYQMPGFSKGIIVDTNDPAGFNRVRVRIPELHGSISSRVYDNAGPYAATKNRVEDDSLPWAEVSYPYGQDNTPEINQVVLVGYLNGNSDQPVIVGWLGYEYTTNEETLVIKTTRG